jgi:hypothetical protein
MATLPNQGSVSNLFEIDKKKNVAQQTVIEKKRALLDTRHKYLLEKFSVFVDEKASVLENSFLLGNKLELVNDFFAENGSKKILFFWQKVKHNNVGRKIKNKCINSNKWSKGSFDWGWSVFY